MDQCPNCKSQRVVDGELMASEGYAVFQPQELRSFTLTLFGGVDLVNRRAQACLDCGFLWGQVDQAKLTTFIRRHCTEETKRRYGMEG